MKDKLNTRLSFLFKPGSLMGILAIAVILFLVTRLGKRDGEDSSLSFSVTKGDLLITVTEGGSIEALKSQEIRSEVKGYQGTKILSIVDEGYQVTDEDVKNKKILVELDSSELRQKIVTQEIQFQSTVASLTEARNARDIQVNQNLSDVKAAELAVKFARMDVEKFLGAEVTKQIFDRLALKQPERIDVTVLPPSIGMGIESQGKTPDKNDSTLVPVVGEITKMAATGYPKFTGPPKLELAARNSLPEPES